MFYTTYGVHSGAPRRLFYDLPHEIQDLILTFHNPFIEYYKKEYKKSLLYIKNLKNNLNPEYYNFITLYKEYENFGYGHFYKKYYLCDCAWTNRVNDNKRIFYTNKTGYFRVFNGSYTVYLYVLNNNTHFKNGGIVKTNINLRIKKHLNSDQHKIWNERGGYNLIDFIPEDIEYSGLYIIYVDDYNIYSELYIYRKTVYEGIKKNKFRLLGYSYTKY